MWFLSRNYKSTSENSNSSQTDYQYHHDSSNDIKKNRQFKSKRCRWRLVDNNVKIQKNLFSSSNDNNLQKNLIRSQSLIKLMERRTTFCKKFNLKNKNPKLSASSATILLIILCLHSFNPITTFGEASLIVGDSAIEITELNQNNQPQSQINTEEPSSQLPVEQPSVILGSTNDGAPAASLEPAQLAQQTNIHQQSKEQVQEQTKPSAGPLPTPIVSSKPEDITDGDKVSRDSHDYDIRELNKPLEKDSLKKVLPIDDDKAIAGKVVDFELESSGGHNKAKIKKKKKKKKKKLEEMEKEWKKKKAQMKKAEDMKVKEGKKEKKEMMKKKKKKWGHHEHSNKKKGAFKKSKFGKKVKKGKGVKKGNKGMKKLKDKGHKKTGFKKVYHIEEYGSQKKWHDIKREKKWDEVAKKWKNNWHKEKAKKYEGEHMKKFAKKAKHGKKFSKLAKEKFKKHKGEKFKKGHKKKMEEHAKKKEGGKKKSEKMIKKKKKKKKP